MKSFPYFLIPNSFKTIKLQCGKLCLKGIDLIQSITNVIRHTFGVKWLLCQNNEPIVINDIDRLVEGLS